ncbi:ABC transporter permease [Bacillus cereus]|uniref:ABC transporter permease n=1 Tax=Bacillus cereus TaxID=1396 RepID=UPI000B4BB14C|nr:ABC transporter permease [Bacillus cereus]
MFKSLLLYESEKFWSKKINIICFIAIPLIVLLSLKFAVQTNATLKPLSVAFSSNLNFHLTSLQEMLFTAFNAIVITFCAISFHEEYKKGALRIPFTRGISLKQLYLAKSLIFMLNIFLILILQLLVSLIIGWLFLPKLTKIPLFFMNGLYGIEEIVQYSFKYYLLGYVSLLAFGSIVEFISLKLKTITGVIGLSLGFIFANLLYIIVISPIIKEYPENHPVVFTYQSLSPILTQVKGAAYFAAGVTNIFLYSPIVIFIVFKTLSYITFTRNDYLD